MSNKIVKMNTKMFFFCEILQLFHSVHCVIASRVCGFGLKKLDSKKTGKNWPENPRQHSTETGRNHKKKNK